MSGKKQSEYSWAIAGIGTALVVLFAAAGAIGAFGHSVPPQLWAAGSALAGGLVGVLVPAPKTTKGAAATARAAGASVVHAAAVKAAKSKAAEIESSQDPDDKKSAATEAATQVADAAQTASTQLARAARPRATMTSATTAIDDAISVHTTADKERADAGTEEVKRAAADAARGAGVQALAQAQAMAVSLPREALKVFIPTFIFAVALYLGIRLSDGSIDYANCPVTSAVSATANEAPCASTLFQTANAMIALASAAGGALVGLFGSPPGQNSVGAT